MGDGKIRIVKIDQTDYRNLRDYWSLSMHDCEYGTIKQICFNYNGSIMFSCGVDGNIFSYNFHPENNDYKPVNLEYLSMKGFVSKKK